ncbi:hypothetical protein G9C85_03380 [Halorubellus sp. JP-L1]|uniref:hypothetical protein n=1 Tax=Halorubellus sp. JP-L1 TaxID=2715753 RepID=UPI00140A183B|nr:hypothetical protein [Halorubellus sp. JP-L1]NHN40678.1 hypothetical protein [Halorubellus sp. JP-L1]
MSAAKSIGNRARTFVRDTGIATGVLVGLYGLAVGVQFQPLQIPGYLLIVGFDLLEVAFGSAGDHYDLLFAAYLLALGVAGATVAHALSGLARDVPRWRVGVAGALSIVGVLSLLFALSVLLGTSQTTPVLVTAAAGLVMLAVAGWLVGSFGE